MTFYQYSSGEKKLLDILNTNLKRFWKIMIFDDFIAKYLWPFFFFAIDKKKNALPSKRVMYQEVTVVVLEKAILSGTLFKKEILKVTS